MSPAPPSTTSENPSDPIQEPVDRVADELVTNFFAADGPNVVIVHYLYGGFDQPGAIRRSAVRVRPGTFLAQAAGKAVVVGCPAEIHERALRRHVQFWDRSNTFLGFVERKLLEVDRADGRSLQRLDLEVILDSKLIDCYDCQDLKAADLDVSELRRRCELRLSEQLLDRLLRSIGLEDYYRGLIVGEGDWRRQFLLARAEAFGRLPGVASDSQPGRWYSWGFLEALQSLLAYFKAGNEPMSPLSEAEAASIGSVIAVRLENGLLKPDPIGVAIVIPGLERHRCDGVERQLRVNLAHASAAVGKPPDAQIQDLKPDFRQDGATRISRSVDMALESVAFPASSQKKRTQVLGFWMLLIAEHLIGRKHEGHPLDFYFALGDESQFRDHPNVVFRGLTDKEVRLFECQPRSPDVDYRDAARRAADSLTREHYPWFANGRYALLWDVARATLIPTGIVGMRMGTWEQLVKERHRDAQTLHLPYCLTGFVLGYQGQAGLLKCLGPANAIETICRWRAGGWDLLSADERAERLKGLISNLLNNKRVPVEPPLGWLDELIALCLRVADDPNTGGIVIICEREVDKKFAKMGRPWNLDGATPEDRIALIAHDGATARCISIDKWHHRLLLRPGELDEDAMRRLEELAHDPASGLRLGGAGSRRWSAALAAFHPDVDAVVVMSQDGDIQYWQVEEYAGSTAWKVTFAELPQGGQIPSPVKPLVI